MRVALKKRHWSANEDHRLMKAVSLYGEGQWNQLAQITGLRRSGKSCRLRWVNYLRPGVKHGHISEAERRVITTLYELFGGRWSSIASYLPGRSDNEIKNYWRCHIMKKGGNKSIATSFSPREENDTLVNNSPRITNCSNSSTGSMAQDDHISSEIHFVDSQCNILDYDHLRLRSQMGTPLPCTDNLYWDVESTLQIVGQHDMDDMPCDLQYDHLWSYE